MGQLRDSEAAPRALKALVDLLRIPDLPLERADLVLKILLEQRDGESAQLAELPTLLVGALRTDSVDVRDRINQTLLYMAEARRIPLADDLARWNQSNGDSTTDLERYIKAWSAYWAEGRRAGTAGRGDGE